MTGTKTAPGVLEVAGDCRGLPRIVRLIQRLSAVNVLASAAVRVRCRTVLGGVWDSFDLGSIPTLASNSKLLFYNELQIPEEASASESASEIITGLPLNNYSGKTRQSLATTGYAARLV